MGIRSRVRAVLAAGTACALAVSARAAGPDAPVLFPVSAAPPASAPHAAGVKDLTPPLFPPPEHNGHAAGGHGNGHGHDCGPHCHGEEHHEGGFFGRAEYLLLRPRRGAFDFAVVDPARDLTPAGTLESLNYELRSGVRAAIGYRIPGSAWDVLFAYTYLESNADRILTAPAAGTLYPTLTRPGLIDEATTAAATADLRYNVFDIEVGRKLHASERATARAFGGARFVTIRQDFDVIYDGRDARNAQVMTRAKFDGFGPTLGGEGTLAIYRGFHVYARGSAGLLTGRVVNSITETNNAGGTVFADLDYRTRKVVPTVGLAIGGGWQYHRVSIRAGYEITHYIGLIDQPRFVNDFSEGRVLTRPADLSLEGLFVQLGLDF